jgi:protein-disulfide isomerase
MDGKDLGEKKENKTNFLKKIPHPVWIFSTFILILLLIIIIFSGSITGNVIGTNTAGEKLVEFLNARVGGDVILEQVNDFGSLYEIIVLYEGEQIPVYITKDGEYMVQSPIAITTDSSQIVQTGEPDWTFFENSLPDDLKQTILSFPDSQAKQTSIEGVYEFEGYNLCKNNLLVFYHPDCGWCERYHPVLKQAQSDFPELKIYTLLLSENRDIAEKYGVSGTPANVINCKYFASGYKDRNSLYEILEEFK